MQVRVSLLNNATKFTPQGGIVRVELATDAYPVRMNVEDNDMGIMREMTGLDFDLSARPNAPSTVPSKGWALALRSSVASSYRTVATLLRKAQAPQKERG